MKRSSRPSRKPSPLPTSTRRRLRMYALAAGATGIGTLALTSHAEAKIVYTPLHKVIGPNQRYLIDLNHDGTADFAIQNLQNCDTDNTCTSFVSAFKYGRNGVEGTHGTQFTPPQAFARKAGERIGPGNHFVGRKMAGAGQTTIGHWYRVSNRYLGLKFQVSGQTHYGWARMSVKLDTGFVVTLTGFAYETTPNKAIIAGKTDDGANAAQESSAVLSPPLVSEAGLGALALGSPGLSIWRRDSTA